MSAFAFHGDESERLNGVTAPDRYSDQFSIQDTPINRIVIDVVNQAIYWQLKRGGAGGYWEGGETLMLPGSRQIVRPGITGIRIRAAVPLASLAVGSLQAVVTVEAVK